MDDARLAQAMAVLGLSPTDFMAVEQAAPWEGPALVREIQARARRAYKRAVLTLHPDKNGGDAEKTDLFRDVTEVLSEIDELRYIPRRTAAKIILELKVSL